MRKLIALLSLLIPIGLVAQISINNTHMPQSGDTLRFSTALPDTAVLLNFQTPGANQTWNFDSLVPLRQGLREFLNSSQTPYSTTVSNRIGEKLADTAGLGPLELYDVYDFYNSTATEFAIDFRGATVPTGLGFPFPPTLAISQSYSDKDEVYQFPLNYLDRDSSTYQFAYQNILLGAYYGSSGYRINEVDAWGSLTTPFGTFDCIRVVTDIVGYDTLSFGGNNFGTNSHTREYKWLTTQFEIPALTINGSVIANNFIPTTVEFRDSVRNVPSIFAPIALFNADETTPNLGDTVNIENFTISLLNANYQWNITPNTFTYLSGTSATSDSLVVVFQDTGFYDVQLIAINSDGRDTLLIQDYIYVDLLTGIADSNKIRELGISAFPNPVSTGAKINFGPFDGLTVERVELIDIKGTLVYSKEFANTGSYIELSAPKTKGIYFYRFFDEETVIEKKVIVSE